MQAVALVLWAVIASVLIGGGLLVAIAERMSHPYPRSRMVKAGLLAASIGVVLYGTLIAVAVYE